MSEMYKGSKISMWCVWDREMMHIPFNSSSYVEREIRMFFVVMKDNSGSLFRFGGNYVTVRGDFISLMIGKCDSESYFPCPRGT